MDSLNEVFASKMAEIEKGNKCAKRAHCDTKGNPYPVALIYERFDFSSRSTIRGHFLACSNCGVLFGKKGRATTTIEGLMG